VLGDVDSTLHDLTNFANYLYGYTILNSSATPCLYVMSKRKCHGHNGEIHTQLWAGYAAHLASQMGPKDEPKRIIIIDLGSGEFKRFICQIQHGKAVEMLSGTSDKVNHEIYKKNVENMLDMLVDEYRDTKKKEESIWAAETCTTYLDSIVKR
jgi:hypothetical protein